MSLRKRRVAWFSIVVYGLLASLALAAPAAEPPAVWLANTYSGDVDVTQYWISEKYDGVRGFWTGEQLITRGGQIIHAPAWFTAGWPHTAMDGELWIDRQHFAQTSGIVRQQQPVAADWRQLHYMVFDLPDHPGPFTERVTAIRELVAAIDQPWVRAVKQYKVANTEQLQRELERVVANGGEGLVLHKGSALYTPGRSNDLLKLKPYQDAEARVLGYNPGQGRLQGLMGSIDVVTPDGRQFAIGSGFTDAERADPPPIGSWVTYRYNGYTSTGLPRFARFMRMRPGGPPPEVPAPDSASQQPPRERAAN